METIKVYEEYEANQEETASLATPTNVLHQWPF